MSRAARDPYRFRNSNNDIRGEKAKEVFLCDARFLLQTY